jgi:hypothetical protein
MPAPLQTAWRFAGKNHFDQAGVSIANAGDINSDGVPDVIVGLVTKATGANGNHTSARVYSGQNGTLLLELPAPAAQNAKSNNVVAGLGDITGDGKAELLVGTPGASPNNITGLGMVRVFDGSNGAVLKEITANGVSANAFFGASLTAIDDVNADALPDFLVGAPGADYIFAYQGKWTGNPGTSFELHIATNAPALPGGVGSNDTYFGASVGPVGKLDGSAGRVAVVVGAPDYPDVNTRTGRIYVLRLGERGRTGAIIPTEVIYVKDGSGPGHLFGVDVDGGIDLNNDGKAEFLGSATGTPPEGPPGGSGYARLYSGADGSLLQSFTSNQPNDAFGFAAELSGPCNNLRTLVVGAPAWINAANKLVGRVLVYDALGGGLISEIAGEHQLENMGMAVGGYVDITGDGNAEFLAGAPGTNIPPGLFGAGAGYVFSCVNLPRPDISAAPNPADFGNVQVGGLQDVVVTVANQGSANLAVAGSSLAPGSNPAFSIVGGSGAFVLAPAATQAITVRYNPAAPGLHGGKLRLQSNDPDTPIYDVPLAGKGINKQIQVTPASINFGNVDVGDTGAAFIQVKNIGNVALTVSGITIGGDGFSLAMLPALPKTLQPGQQFSFQARFAPASIAGFSGAVNVASDDPAAPNVAVPLAGNGVAVNLRPTARITMEVPYNGDSIQFHGDGSFDPDGTIVSYAWDFGHDNATSNEMNPLHQFPDCFNPAPCRYVVRLLVTDNGGKSDPTSITALGDSAATSTVLPNPRSRFYGAIQQGGGPVPDGTVVSAWVNGNKVAESTTQTHLGQSVFAIEVPPDTPSNEGGVNGDTVVFKYNLATADQTGIWYTKTDQELNLTAPFYVPPFIDWCLVAKWLGWELCGPSVIVPGNGFYIELQEWPVPPILDPGPLRLVGKVFNMQLSDGATGAPITTFAANYKMTLRYTNAELAEAGVVDESTLQLFYVDETSNRWLPAVQQPAIDTQYNKLSAELNHATVFALFAESTLPAEPSKGFMPLLYKND